MLSPSDLDSFAPLTCLPSPLDSLHPNVTPLLTEALLS